MPLCNGTDTGCVSPIDNIAGRESALTSFRCFPRENWANRFQSMSFVTATAEASPSPTSSFSSHPVYMKGTRVSMPGQHVRRWAPEESFDKVRPKVPSIIRMSMGACISLPGTE
jgi:hypothetical protein